MYFEIVRNDETLVRGNDCFGVAYNLDINSQSSFSVILPIYYYRYVQRRNEIKIYLDDGTLAHGVMDNKSVDKVNETIDLDYSQILGEWDRECVPINVIKKHEMISDLMVDPDTAYQEVLWDVRVIDDYDIEYEFSRETKLEALNKIINMTPDINYRVSRTEDRVLEIAKFGEQKNYMITSDNMLGGVTIEENMSDIINVAVSYGDRNDGGATSVTLRDVSADVSLQDPNFPVYITGKKINTAAPPVGYSYTEYAPNNVHEYAVVDLVGLEQEDGDIYEGTFTMNDVTPLEEDGEEISNEDRIAASKVIYERTVRKLIHSRRNPRITVSTYDLPIWVNVGDMIRFVLNNTDSRFDECVGFITEDVVQYDKWVYVLNIDITTDAGGNIMYAVTLSETLAEYFTSREV